MKKILLVFMLFLTIQKTSQAGGEDYSLRFFCYNPFSTYLYKMSFDSYSDTLYFWNVQDTVHITYYETGSNSFNIHRWTLYKDNVMIDSQFVNNNFFKKDIYENGRYDFYGHISGLTTGNKLAHIMIWATFSGSLSAPQTQNSSLTFAMLNAQQKIQFQGLPEIEEATLNVYSILGQRIWSEKIQNIHQGNYTSFNSLANYTTGLYLWTIENKNIQLKNKIILP